MKDNSNPDINFNDDRSTKASNLYIYVYIYIYIRSLNVIIFHKEWYKISLELAKKFQLTIMVSADVKTDLKHKRKELMAIPYNFL